MRHRRFMRDNLSLLSFYEHNYMLFRLLLPQLPQRDGWHVLESSNRQRVFLRRTAWHAYTSEWLLAHYFPKRSAGALAPDYPIRVYHDARLLEARIDPLTPVVRQRSAKLAHNRALGEWLDYCYRNGYRWNMDAQVQDLPAALVTS